MKPVEHLTMSDLTLAERGEIERAFDGPITPQAIADKIAERDRPKVKAPDTVESLTHLTRFLQSQRAFYQDCLDTADAEIARLQEDRDRTPEGVERDKKTRRLAGHVMNRQSPVDQVDHFNGLLHDVSVRLSKLNMAQRAQQAAE